MSHPAAIAPTHDRRIDRVRRRLPRLGLDALLVLIQENRRYLSGFTGEDGQFNESAGVLIVTGERTVLATDSRYDLQAEQETEQVEVVRYAKGWTDDLPAILADMQIRRLGFESARMTVLQHDKFTTQLKATNLSLELVPVEGLVESLRERKDATEVDLTRRAVEAAESAFDRLLFGLRPGLTEASLAWALEQALRDAGAEGPSFPIIVAAGPNSALPHATPGERPVAAGEPVLFDWGARMAGYCSDMSRTFILGAADDTFRRVFGVVREAQLRAIDAIRVGMKGLDVDAVARQHIDATEFTGKFGHSLGHGTGLAIHEGPKLSPTSDSILEAGMVVTVEPGIYLPGWGGVRLENQVLVTENGAEVLNRMAITDDALPTS